ncbi:Elongator complex protein 5 [Kickxella alabastrina]|uniref:Elongator complex protein 5 n=1 Tax=Kickxella alabastrina TaxID=61397 RepID=UPI00221EEF31|nr:Elongator complex protein 5 [Kickxella alabastrina]KAI7834312.1 Elongator complex protein 5 [Kickxella alabastrina]KAJ1941262.1 Elongator complex protein [Kickxella alabastrina]
MSATGLSIRRLAAYQQYTAPLVILSETVRQTALPLQEAMVRESLVRGMYVIAVCLEGLPSSDIRASPLFRLVDQRPTVESILSVQESSPSSSSYLLPGLLKRTDFARLQSEIEGHIRRAQEGGVAANGGSGGDSRTGVLVFVDSIDRLLRSSRASTLALLRSIRGSVGNSIKSRFLIRFSCDASVRYDSSQSKSPGVTDSLYTANALCDLADVMVDVHPLDDLKTWMPGWYSDGNQLPFISLRDNDPRRGLVRLEHKRQSGKIGFEVATFEIDPQTRLPKFLAVDVSAGSQLPQHVAPASGLALAPQAGSSSAPPQANTAATAAAAVAANNFNSAVVSQTQHASLQPSSDPAANLSFNLNLTDRQRRDKASVEMPYMDAQMASASGEPPSDSVGAVAGDIFYQLDDEDDWDEDDPDDDLEI